MTATGKTLPLLLQEGLLSVTDKSIHTLSTGKPLKNSLI